MNFNAVLMGHAVCRNFSWHTYWVIEALEHALARELG